MSLRAELGIQANGTISTIMDNYTFLT